MQSLLSIFREVRDPRDFNARHELPAILFIALAATLCGAKSCVAIADFAAAYVGLLKEIVDLPHGPPSHDCFSRVFRLLDPEETLQALTRFVAALREGLGLGPANGVVAIDGKRMRRGYERGRACMPPLMVSVWDADTRLSLSARHAPGGNEVAATLAALKSLVLKGCIVTADALHCHPAMAAEVRKTGAHYALKLKANNAPLYTCVEAAFAAADNDKKRKLAFHEESEFAHDRHERRRASVIKRPAKAPDFPDLAAVGRIIAERQVGNGKLTKRVHYVVMSKRLSPMRMLEVTRTHWCVENQLHWPLDVVFHEDDARTRKDYGPQNLAIMRRIAIDILRAHPDNRSVGRKMNLAAWKREFFFDLFTHLR
jgi:predicted transposase YbfD/YdcC